MPRPSSSPTGLTCNLRSADQPASSDLLTNLQVVFAVALLDPDNALKLRIHHEGPALAVGQDGPVLHTCRVRRQPLTHPAGNNGIVNQQRQRICRHSSGCVGSLSIYVCATCTACEVSNTVCWSLIDLMVRATIVAIGTPQTCPVMLSTQHHTFDAFSHGCTLIRQELDPLLDEACPELAGEGASI